MKKDVCQTCKCISQNRPNKTQKVPCVKIIPPFPNRPYGSVSTPHKPVLIDACIVKVLEHLWVNNIYTLNSCCGHNWGNPSIVLENNTHEENAEVVRKLIAEVDKREWDIQTWKLITL